MGQRLDVIVHPPIDKNKLRIVLAEGLGWNTKIFLLFDGGEARKSSFPEEPGIFNIVVNYDDSLQYNEVILFRTHPKEERLRFEFYQDQGRVFCRIESRCAFELNKEIVMNQLTDEQRKFFEISKGEDI